MCERKTADEMPDWIREIINPTPPSPGMRQCRNRIGNGMTVCQGGTLIHGMGNCGMPTWECDVCSGTGWVTQEVYEKQ